MLGCWSGGLEMSGREGLWGSLRGKVIGGIGEGIRRKWNFVMIRLGIIREK